MKENSNIRIRLEALEQIVQKGTTVAEFRALTAYFKIKCTAHHRGGKFSKQDFYNTFPEISYQPTKDKLLESMIDLDYVMQVGKGFYKINRQKYLFTKKKFITISYEQIMRLSVKNVKGIKAIAMEAITTVQKKRQAYLAKDRVTYNQKDKSRERISGNREILELDKVVSMQMQANHLNTSITEIYRLRKEQTVSVYTTEKPVCVKSAKNKYELYALSEEFECVYKNLDKFENKKGKFFIHNLAVYFSSCSFRIGGYKIKR